MINSELFKKYIRCECTSEERQLIEDWLSQYNANKPDDFSEIHQMIKTMDKRMIATIPLLSNRKNYLAYALVAASVLLFFTFFFLRINQENQFILFGQKEILAPTGNNAIIILEDGSTHELDNLKQFDTIDANSYLITRNQNGQLVYIEKFNNDALVYNTIQTKIGGIVNFKLSDGSEVWINSKSKITYPIKFSQEVREVTIEGEAYFEVVSSHKLTNNPKFLVKTESHIIEVVGTKFNVNTYKGNYKTSLLEGHIKIEDTSIPLANNLFELHPNQIFDGKHIYNNSNIERCIDWKSGYFDLANLTLVEVADKLENWYGVEFEIEKSIQNRKVFGLVSRNKSLQEVIYLISNAIPIEYRIKSNKVYIYQKLI